MDESETNQKPEIKTERWLMAMHNSLLYLSFALVQARGKRHTVQQQSPQCSVRCSEAVTCPPVPPVNCKVRARGAHNNHAALPDLDIGHACFITVRVTLNTTVQLLMLTFCVRARKVQAWDYTLVQRVAA